MSAEDEFIRLLSDSEANGIDVDSPGIKSLRKAYDKLKAEADGLRTQVQEQTKTTRANSLKETLAGFGAKPGLAKYFPQDAEVTEASVKSWLEEDGEIFGWQPSEKVPDAELDAAKLIAQLQPNPAGSGDLAARVAGLSSQPVSKTSADEAGRAAAELTQLLGASLAAGPFGS